MTPRSEGRPQSGGKAFVHVTTGQVISRALKSAKVEAATKFARVDRSVPSRSPVFGNNDSFVKSGEGSIAKDSSVGARCRRSLTHMEAAECD